MDYSQSFSVLNEKLRPRSSTSEQLFSSLSRLEDRKLDWTRSTSMSYRPTMLLAEPEPKVTITETEELEESESNSEQEELTCGSKDEECSEELMTFDDRIADLSLKEVDDEEMHNDNSSISQSEETDSAGELASEETRDPSKSEAAADEGDGPFQRSYMDRTLPDLIKSGRPLCRRRTVGHVSETLKEVRREVELSRRRSIKLKAQVDRLQEDRDGLGWSKHKDSVTQEVLSVLGLLHPLVEPESSQLELDDKETRLDVALTQLQIVARKLAISHTNQKSKSGAEDSAILQQALRNRDEAIEKKKAMEAEVLRSKTEMMWLNNQLLEAAQKRLELSLELEAWKDDFQRLLQQQVQIQQQAEQAQKKSTRLGILRRSNKPIQRPTSFPLPVSTPPTTNPNQIFMTGSGSGSGGSISPTPSSSSGGSGKGTWRFKLKKGKSSHFWDQDGAEQDSDRSRYNDGFQVVSLD